MVRSNDDLGFFHVIRFFNENAIIVTQFGGSIQNEDQDYFLKWKVFCEKKNKHGRFLLVSSAQFRRYRGNFTRGLSCLDEEGCLALLRRSTVSGRRLG